MMMKSVVASSDYNYYRLNVAKASTTSNNSGSSKTNNNKLDRRRTMLGLFGVGVSSSSNNKIAKFSANASSSQQQKENAENAIAQVLKDPQWPPVYPFTTKDMGRYDESSDAFFYEQPRLVKHIDDQAIDALTKYYSEVFKTVEDDDDQPAKVWFSVILSLLLA